MIKMTVSLLIRSDNASSQYKSGLTCQLNFSLCWENEIDILRVYGCPQHSASLELMEKLDRK